MYPFSLSNFFLTWHFRVFCAIGVIPGGKIAKGIKAGHFAAGKAFPPGPHRPESAMMILRYSPGSPVTRGAGPSVRDDRAPGAKHLMLKVS